VVHHGVVGIIDYGAGNLGSVKRALDYLGIENRIVAESKDFFGIEKIIFPGVGALGASIEKLKKGGLYQALKEWVADDKPFLGICLGMQLLFEESEESPKVKGMGIFNGKVIRFRHMKNPQIGWNQIIIRRKDILLDGVRDGSFFYFLHGYFVSPKDDSLIIATTGYGISYASIIQKGNIRAVQFHPEKSGEVGLKVIKNWGLKC